jgi:hypothetical protein
MEGGDDALPRTDLPAPPDGAIPTDDPASVATAATPPPVPPPPPPPTPTPEASSEPVEPMLPPAEAEPSPPMVPDPNPPSRGASTWYRTDQDRYRSVRRRANPWYRRLARGAIGAAFLGAAGVGLFFAARVVQDFLDRDRLPSQGADTPAIRATSFEIRSTTPAPVLDGTLTLDTESRAFEFIGRGTGTQAGIQIVSPDGATVYVRREPGAWQTPNSDDQIAIDVQRAVDYLSDDDSADDILTSQLRRGYVDLIDRVELGTGDNELLRYEMRLDTASFEDDYPVQFREFEDSAIPGVQPVRGLLVTITLDNDNVLVQVDDSGTNWSWQRLTYTDQSFSPADPSALDGTIQITDGTVDDG